MGTIAGKKPNIIVEFFKRLFFWLPQRPSFAQIEITNRCNFNCAMCPRGFLRVEYKDMDFELFKGAVSRLEGIYEINLTGWGEPLMHLNLPEMIQYCKELGFKTDLTSNGSLLTSAIADKLINAGLDKISFSIDSLQIDASQGHIISNQIKNIKDFALRKNHPPITIQTTVHKGRLNDIMDVIKFAKEIHAEKVNLARLDMRFDPRLRRPSQKEEREIAKQAVSLGNKIGMRVDFLPYEVGKNKLERLFYRLFKRLLHRYGQYCLKLYNQIYLNVDVFVTPCCALPRYKLMNILESDLRSIWKGKEMDNFRKNNQKICGICDVATIRQKT